MKVGRGGGETSFRSDCLRFMITNESAVAGGEGGGIETKMYGSKFEN